MKGYAAVLLSLVITAWLIASNAPSYIILRERRTIATVTDNPSGLIGIITNNLSKYMNTKRSKIINYSL